VTAESELRKFVYFNERFVLGGGETGALRRIIQKNVCGGFVLGDLRSIYRPSSYTVSLYCCLNVEEQCMSARCAKPVTHHCSARKL
jgi:hypothetical protein